MLALISRASLAALVFQIFAIDPAAMLEDDPTPTPAPTETAVPTPTPSPEPTQSEAPETATPVSTETPIETETPAETETPEDSRPAPRERYYGRPYGDFDNSGCTDVVDFVFILDNWQRPYDANTLATQDFFAMLDHWAIGRGCPPPR